MKKEKYTTNEFMTDDMWLLYIDAYRLDEGPRAFDKPNSQTSLEGEPGYVQGMESAQRYMDQRLDQPITVDFILQVHDKCIDPVGTISKEVKGLRNAGTKFGLGMRPDLGGHYNNVSPSGLVELAQRLEQNMQTRINGRGYPIHHVQYQDYNTGFADTYFVFTNDQSLNEGRAVAQQNNIRPKDAKYVTAKVLQDAMQNVDVEKGNFYLTAAGTNIEELTKMLNDDINNFNTQLASAKTSGDPDQVLQTIIGFVQVCEQAHYFKDGNQRTTVSLVLNHLLKQNGFEPTILKHPNHFDGFSVAELVQEVKDGMELYQEFSTKKLQDVVKETSPKKISADRGEFKQKINSQLSDNPIVQLAQLNDLNNHLEQGDLKPQGDGKLNPFLTKNAVTRCKYTVKELYNEKVDEIHRTLKEQPDAAPVKSMEVLQDIVNNHPIANGKEISQDFVLDTVELNQKTSLSLGGSK